MTRDKKIDVMKGILIILVVVGHSGYRHINFIYLFHMAIFFMISGYLFNDKYTYSSQMIQKFIKEKIKKIWLPYFTWSVIFVCVNNVFLRLHIYSDTEINHDVVNITASSFYHLRDMGLKILQGFYFSTRTEMGGTFWFFKTLFGVSVLYAVIDFITKQFIRKERTREIIHSIAGGIFLAVGYICKLKNIMFFSIPIILSIYLLFHIGVMIRKKQVMERIPKKGIISVASFVLLLICQRTGKISININEYSNPVFLIIASLAGWNLVYVLSEKIEPLKLGQWLNEVGKHSLIIMILHFLSFKLVTLIQLAIYNEPIDYLAAFPYLHSESGWWLVYTVAGVMIPLVVYYGYLKLAIVIKKGLKRIHIKDIPLTYIKR